MINGRVRREPHHSRDIGAREKERVVSAAKSEKNQKLANAFIANATTDLICTSCECAYIVLKVNARLNATFRLYKIHLGELSDMRLSVKCKRKDLQTAGLPSLLANSVIFPLIKLLLRPWWSMRRR